MKHLARLFVFAFLAACATPQEQCINTAANTVQRLQSDIARTGGNIARGFAIHTQQQSYEVANICYDWYEKPYTCMQTEFRTIKTPVAVNVADERLKLAEMQRRLPQARRAMLQGIESCKRRYPQ